MSNFRKSLITKCMGDAGSVEADADALHEVLNGNADVEVFQLRTYTWRHVIPAAHRVQLYKHLLSVSSCHRETREVVEKHRREEAEILLRCLRTLQAFSGSMQGDVPVPTIWDIVKMLLLARSQLNEKIISMGPEQCSSRNRELFPIYEVVRQINQLCPTEWVDVFCISRGILRVLEEAFDRQTLDSTVKDIRAEVEQTLKLSPEEMGKLWELFDVETWLRCGMCSMITSERALFRIIDKVCTATGVVPLLKTLCLDYILHTDKLVSEGGRYQNDDKKVRVMSSDGEMRMVNRAVEQAGREMKGTAGRIDRVRLSMPI